jgi:hypothetical protein
MPVEVAATERIALARVYDALDAEAYRAFRAAMRRSRGGTVRVADLLAALAETAPQTAARILGLTTDALASLAHPPASDPDIVPMANEPALRALLSAAYRSAGGQSITPEHILSVLAETHARSPVSSHRSAPPRPPDYRPTGPAEWTGEAAVSVLASWLASQSLPPHEREARLELLAPGLRPRSRE